MLTPELVDALQAPISAASPCGDDLEYDPAFTALEAAAQGKPEQQFGDTVIPALEPDWRVVAEQAEALLRRAKDIRPAVLLLRASVRMQGLAGLNLGLKLLGDLLDVFWADIHPRLDADDGNDSTMRLNALTPLADEKMLLRDAYEARIGVSRGLGPIRVRDIAIAYNALSAVGGEAGYSMMQVDGALDEIRAQSPDLPRELQAVQQRVERLQALVNDRAGRADVVDLSRLRTIGMVLAQASRTLAAAQDAAPASAADAGTGATALPAANTAAGTSGAARGEIRSRQDALQTLDRVIHYLQQAEPGNPAPLLLQRAKQLIGVSFFDIMANLAPNALDTIETVTGKRPETQ